MDHRPRFVIEAAKAESMAQQSGQTVLQLLPSLVKPAKSLARPPISKFHVGAVGYGSSGRIFIGVNVEFPGLPLHHSIHAEQFLVTNLSLHSEPRLDSIAVSSAPCGHCRQFLQELRGAPNIKIHITEQDDDDDDRSETEFEPLVNLLPRRFGPDDLLSKGVPLLLEPHENGLEFPIEIESVCNGDENGFVYGELKQAALEAANKSHAPYSKCPSGVALVDCEGKVYRGSYMESAAYNPSLGPVQSALVSYIASGCGGYERITAAILVEKEGALIKQEETARLLLRSISPRCEFRAFHCVSGCCKKGCS